MNSDASDDGAALQDSVARWVRQNYAFDRRRKPAASAPGFSAAQWRETAQLGWRPCPSTNRWVAWAVARWPRCC